VTVGLDGFHFIVVVVVVVNDDAMMYDICEKPFQFFSIRFSCGCIRLKN
jgi:hypothetical protein